MPKVGASQLYVAKYHVDKLGRISYTDGCLAARLASWSMTLNTSDSNSDYLDNHEAETAGGEFTGGTLAVGIGEFTQRADEMVLGTKRGKLMVNGREVEGMVYCDNLSRPYLGTGFIEKLIVRGETKWRGIVLLKTRFNIPDDQVETQGQTINWQHDTINATVMRSDNDAGAWRIYDEFSTESQAAGYVRKIFDIHDAELEKLTVISVAGSTTGTTSITADPEMQAESGRTYRYKVGTDLTLPAYGDSLTAWSTWDGVSDISAAAGDKIILAEVDAAGIAMAAGMADVTVKED